MFARERVAGMTGIRNHRMSMLTTMALKERNNLPNESHKNSIFMIKSTYVCANTQANTIGHSYPSTQTYACLCGHVRICIRISMLDMCWCRFMNTFFFIVLRMYVCICVCMYVRIYMNIRSEKTNAPKEMYIIAFAWLSLCCIYAKYIYIYIHIHIHGWKYVRICI